MFERTGTSAPREIHRTCEHPDASHEIRLESFLTFTVVMVVCARCKGIITSTLTGMVP